MAEHPVDRRDGSLVGDPARHGLDPEILGEMRRGIASEKLDNVHATLIARDGVLVYEQYRHGLDRNGRAPPAPANFDANTPRRGWIDRVDTPILSYFPEYGDIRASATREITVRHLLAVSDGLAWFEWVSPRDSMRRMDQAPDPYRYFLERESLAPPGRIFNYNSGATELLAAILRKRTGKTVDVLAREELFDPLGITDVEWNRVLSNGFPMASSALRARPRDWAKIGQLVLNRGLWPGQEIVPSDWIAASMSPQNNGPMQFLYRFHWWLGRSFHRGRAIEWAGAMGWAGQRLIIIPALKMVVLVNAWLPERMNLAETVPLNQYILPAVVAG